MPSYRDFLAAKKTVDDRSLNQGVVDRLRRELGPSPRVLELGAGLGTMVARLLEWGVLTSGEYCLLDVEASFLQDAREWLRAWAARAGVEAVAEGELLKLGDLSVRFLQAELGDYLERGERPAVDLLIANAFLDLVEVGAVLPRLFELVAPGGLYWFSINYDGLTDLQPELPDDERLLLRYNQTMDERRRYGRPAGESRTGRHLFAHLRQARASLLAAGSSDWVVFGGPQGYPAEEKVFLEFLLDTMADSLGDQPGLDDWIALRREQLERAELVFLAHQLDFLGRVQ